MRDINKNKTDMQSPYVRNHNAYNVHIIYRDKYICITIFIAGDSTVLSGQMNRNESKNTKTCNLSHYNMHFIDTYMKCFYFYIKDNI